MVVKAKISSKDIETLRLKIEKSEDPAWTEYKAAKPTNQMEATQRAVVEFFIFAGYETPTELKNARLKELSDPMTDGGVRGQIRDYRDTYVLRLCKGCSTLRPEPAPFGEVVVCDKCGGDSLAPKTRTGKLTAVEGFLTNTIGTRAKALGKGELNKESDDTVSDKYAISLDTIDRMARVADTKERAFLFIEAHTGMDAVDMATVSLDQNLLDQIMDDTQDIIVIHNKTRRKETGRGGRPYSCALCGEGADAYRAYFRKAGLRLNDPMMKGKEGKPLSGRQGRDYLKSMKAKAAIETGGLRLDLKTLRAFAFTALSAAEGVMCQGNDFGKYCTGKTVPPSIQTYMISHDDELRKGYTSVMARLNPNMAKYQETLTLKDRVATLESQHQKMAGALENMQGQISAMLNGKTGIVDELMEAAAGD